MQEIKPGLTEVGNSIVLVCRALVDHIRKTTDKLKLKKRPVRVVNIEEPKSKKSYNVDVSKNAAKHRKKYKEYLDYFDKGLKINVNPGYLTNYDTNYQKLDVRGVLFEPSCPLGFDEKFLASYSAKYNELFVQLGDNFSPSAFYDELMMVACSSAIETPRMGFKFEDYGQSFGSSLTTGYVSYLNQNIFADTAIAYAPPHSDKYFAWRKSYRNDNYAKNPYVPVDLNFCVASMLEATFGKDVMHSYFFRAKGEAFAREQLMKYEPTQDMERIRGILHKLDALSTFDSSKGKDLEAITDILTTVTKWFFVRSLQEGRILSEDQKLDFIDKMPSFYYNGKEVFEISGETIFNNAKDQAMKERREGRKNRRGFTKATFNAWNIDPEVPQVMVK